MQLVDPATRFRNAIAAKATQGSAAWHDARVGRVTCSRLNDILATNKNGTPSKSRNDYLIEKLVERITGNITDHYVTGAMIRGQELEPIARSIYATARRLKVEEVGSIAHPSLEGFSGSPDGLVGDHGIIEIKTSATPQKHLARVLTKDYSEYIAQVQGNLACTGRQWADLILYDDRFPENMRTHIARIERDERLIEEIEDAVRAFLRDLVELHEQAMQALPEGFEP